MTGCASYSWLQWESRTFGPSDAPYDPVDSPDDDEMESPGRGGRVATTPSDA
jgi:hypothetical protein